MEKDLKRGIVMAEYATPLLQYSTILPFRGRSGHYVCFYCDENFTNIEGLGAHTTEHIGADEINKAMSKLKRKVSFISVNVANLECKLCDDVLRDDLYDLEEHISRKHDVVLPYTDDPVLVPYNIAEGVCKCAICDKEFGGFNFLSSHMNEHFPKFKCKSCGAGFLTIARLHEHIKKRCAKILDEGVTDYNVTGVDSDMDETVEQTQRKRKKTVSRRSYVNKVVTMTNALMLIKNSRILPFRLYSNFKCFYCDEDFASIDELQVHNDLDHENVDEITLKTILLKMNQNFSVKVNVAKVDCRLCDDVINDFADLKSHLLNKHKKNVDLKDDNMIVPFKIANGICECALCGDVYQSCHLLNRHMNSHFGRYVCDQCGASFLSHYRLKAHAVTHQKHSHLCETCDKSFKSRGSLTSHVKRVHRRITSAKCPHCAETFHDYYARQKHIVSVHDIEVKMHSCDLCDSVFLVSGHLKKHVREIHERERNHRCAQCDKVFFHMNRLEKHVMSVHYGVTYQCYFCSKYYSNQWNLATHVRQMHPGNKFKCEKCDKEFVIKNSLDAHVRKYHKNVDEASFVEAVFDSDSDE